MNWAGTLLLQCRGGVSASHTWISPGKHMSTREGLALREEIPQRDNPAWQLSMPLSAHDRAELAAGRMRLVVTTATLWINVCLSAVLTDEKRHLWKRRR